MRDYRNLAALILGLSLLQISIGALAVAVPLALQAAGATAPLIGLVAASYSGGFLAGAIGAPAVIRTIGHIRAYAAGAAVAAALALALYAKVDPFLWMVLRFGAGAMVALLFAAGESWVNSAAPPARRGALLSFYMLTAKFGAVSGPFLVAGFTPGAPGVFMIAGAVFALCLVPIAATRQAQPAAPSAERFGPKRLWETAPAAVYAAIAAGIVNGAVAQLYAVYVEDIRPGAAGQAAAAFNAAMLAGSVLSQWPAGAISDRIDRRLVIAALAAAAALASVALTLAPAQTPQWLWLLAAGIWGAGAYSFYGVAVAHAADRAPEGYMTQTMAGILILWGAGAIAGPLVAGAAMATPLGGRALFVLAAAGFGPLAIMMLRQMAARAAPPPEAKAPFAPAQATSVAAAELHPAADPAPAAQPEPKPPAATGRS